MTITILILAAVTAAVLAIGELVLGAVVAAVALAVSGLVSAAISPRKIGRAHHLLISATTARMVRGLRLSLGPLPEWLSRMGAKLLPGTAGADQGFFDDDELREFVTRANESDLIEDSEAELLQSVFDFSATRVRAVMVPRTGRRNRVSHVLAWEVEEYRGARCGVGTEDEQPSLHEEYAHERV